MIESGAQLFTRVQKNVHLGGLYRELLLGNDPVPNQMIEITGEPDTGKSMLLLDFLARCILPESCKGPNFSGKNSSAIFINTDHKCNLFTLVEIINAYLIKYNKNYTQIQIKNVTEECLKRLTVLNCYDSDQFKMTLLNTERIVWKNSNISLVVIDSISTYYWCDRKEVMSLNKYNTKIILLLNKIIQDSRLIAVYTKASNDVEKEHINNCNSDYKIILLKFDLNKHKAIVKTTKIDNILFYSINKIINWFEN